MTTAKEIMVTELIFAHPRMTVEEAIKTLVNNKITGMPVVDEKKRLIGVVSEYDIIKAVDQTESDQIELGEPIQFKTEVFSIPEDTTLPDILSYFVEQKIRRLPVVNKKNELVGIITRRDIMKVLFYRSKQL